MDVSQQLPKCDVERYFILDHGKPHLGSEIEVKRFVVLCTDTIFASPPSAFLAYHELTKKGPTGYSERFQYAYKDYYTSDLTQQYVAGVLLRAGLVLPTSAFSACDDWFPEFVIGKYESRRGEFEGRIFLVINSSWEKPCWDPSTRFDRPSNDLDWRDDIENARKGLEAKPVVGQKTLRGRRKRQHRRKLYTNSLCESAEPGTVTEVVTEALTEAVIETPKDKSELFRIRGRRKRSAKRRIVVNPSLKPSLYQTEATRQPDSELPRAYMSPKWSKWPWQDFTRPKFRLEVFLSTTTLIFTPLPGTYYASSEWPRTQLTYHVFEPRLDAERAAIIIDNTGVSVPDYSQISSSDQVVRHLRTKPHRAIRVVEACLHPDSTFEYWNKFRLHQSHPVFYKPGAYWTFEELKSKRETAAWTVTTSSELDANDINWPYEFDFKTCLSESVQDIPFRIASFKHSFLGGEKVSNWKSDHLRWPTLHGITHIDIPMLLSFRHYIPRKITQFLAASLQDIMRTHPERNIGFDLAFCFLGGFGVDVDVPAGLRLMSKCAEEGHKNALLLKDIYNAYEQSRTHMTLKSALHSACLHGNMKYIMDLVDVDVNEVCEMSPHVTPILCALRGNQVALAKYLLSHGASCRQNILDLGINHYSRQEYLPTALHNLVHVDESALRELFPLIIAQGGDVRCKADADMLMEAYTYIFGPEIYVAASVTPLRWAVMHENVTLIKLLLENIVTFTVTAGHTGEMESDENSETKSEEKYMFFESACANREILDIFYSELVKHGCNLPRNFAFSPLGLLVCEEMSFGRQIFYKGRWLDAVLYLHEKYQPDDGAHLLLNSIKYGHMDLLKHLVSTWDIETRFRGLTPLQIAMRYQRREEFVYLLTQGADIHARAGTSEEDNSSLFILLNERRDDIETICFMLEKMAELGVDLNERESLRAFSIYSIDKEDNDQFHGSFKVPLQRAIDRGRFDVVRKLVELGADPWISKTQDLSANTSRKSILGKMLKHYKRYEISFICDVIKLFLQCSRSPFASNVIQHLLRSVVLSNMLAMSPILATLLSALPKDHINTIDEDGDTLLHYAATTRSDKLVRRLVEDFGADPSLRNKRGFTAADTAALSVLLVSKREINTSPVVSGEFWDLHVWDINIQDDKYLDEDEYLLRSTNTLVPLLDRFEGYGVTVDSKLKKMALVFEGSHKWVLQGERRKDGYFKLKNGFGKSFEKRLVSESVKKYGEGDLEVNLRKDLIY